MKLEATAVQIQFLLTTDELVRGFVFHPKTQGEDLRQLLEEGRLTDIQRQAIFAGLETYKALTKPLCDMLNAIPVDDRHLVFTAAQAYSLALRDELTAADLPSDLTGLWSSDKPKALVIMNQARLVTLELIKVLNEGVDPTEYIDFG